LSGSVVRRLKGLAVALAALACIAAAAEPNERLADPAQEARSRELFREIRCLVCQNESIDDSQAELAQDLRDVVLGQVRQGRSGAEIRAFFVERYGEFVLLRPPFSAGNAILWLTPVVALLAGGGLMIVLLRRRATVIGVDQAPDGLSPEEEARLQVLLKDQ